MWDVLQREISPTYVVYCMLIPRMLTTWDYLEYPVVAKTVAEIKAITARVTI